jgi:hypothetical protein
VSRSSHTGQARGSRRTMVAMAVSRTPKGSQRCGSPADERLANFQGKNNQAAHKICISPAPERENSGV